MRREWTGWIRERNWKEFERLAKADPSQPLVDTIAELERGFPEKPDRKALRKVLFILGRQGYQPQPIEDPAAEEPERVPAKPLEFAFMLSPDARGTESVTYGCVKDGRCLILYVDLGTREGILRAEETDVSIDQGEKYAERARNTVGTSAVDAEVPPDFALARIAKAASITRGPLPTTIAYWRAKLDRVGELTHPAESLPRTEGTADDRRAALSMPATTFDWRLEPEVFAFALDEIYQGREENGWSEEETMERVQKALAAARDRVFTDEVVADHALRMLDLAYLLHRKNRPGVGLLLWSADDLRARRGDSEYGRMLISRAAELVRRSFSGKPLMVRTEA